MDGVILRANSVLSLKKFNCLLFEYIANNFLSRENVLFYIQVYVCTWIWIIQQPCVCFGKKDRIWNNFALYFRSGNFLGNFLETAQQSSKILPVVVRRGNYSLYRFSFRIEGVLSRDPTISGRLLALRRVDDTLLPCDFFGGIYARVYLSETAAPRDPRRIISSAISSETSPNLELHLSHEGHRMESGLSDERHDLDLITR